MGYTVVGDEMCWHALVGGGAQMTRLTNLTVYRTNTDAGGDRLTLHVLADDAGEKESTFRSKQGARQSSPVSERSSKTAPIFPSLYKLMARHI